MCHNGTTTLPPLVAAPSWEQLGCGGNCLSPSQNGQNGRFGLLFALAPFCANKCQLLSLTNKKSYKIKQKSIKRQGEEEEEEEGAETGEELMMLPHASHWRPQ